MQGFAAAFITNPALTLATGLVFGVLLAVIVQRAREKLRKPRNPLQSLFHSHNLNEEARAIAARKVSARRSNAVLRARVDHLPQIEQLWGHDTRNSAIEQVAQVLRAGVRKGDNVTAEKHADDVQDGADTIEISANGVSEAEAGAIARRLLDTLAHMPVPGMSESMRVSASFGVAARRPNESEEEMRSRAEVALAAAQAAGEEQVFEASEWEEIKLLPAPEPVPNFDAAQSGETKAA